MAKKAGTQDTRDQILDVAERHFALYGYAGTSLRAVIKDADVNVAAIAYHFGDKEQLFTAVVERFAVPVVAEQLNRLRSELERSDVVFVDVLRAFYEPPIALIHKLGPSGETLSLFLGRFQTEASEPIYGMVDEHYSACRDEFIQAFRKFFPSSTEADHQWNFEFMLSLIVCFLTRQKPIRQRYEDEPSWNPEDVISRLIAFCMGGFAT